MALFKISVIMLTYNRENLVGRAIESILSQSFCDFEFIIVDNGSTDKSGSIADEYALSDNRIKVIHRDKGTIGSGRNTGLEIATGEYITFIDDDDYAEPDMLEFLYNLAKANNADISICGSWRETDGVKTPKYVSDELLVLDAEQGIVELLKRERYNSGNAAKLFKTYLFSNIRFPEDKKFDDIHTVYKLFSEAMFVVVQNVPKYIATRHVQNNSASTTDAAKITPDYLSEYLNAYSERTAYLLCKFPELKEFLKYTEWSFMISMVEKIKRYNLDDCNEPLIHMQKELKGNRNDFLCSLWTQEFETNWMNEYVKQ